MPVGHCYHNRFLSQSDKFWTVNTESRNSIVTDKAGRQAFIPKEFKLFNLTRLRFVSNYFGCKMYRAGASVVITLPNAAGSLETFEVFRSFQL